MKWTCEFLVNNGVNGTFPVRSAERFGGIAEAESWFRLWADHGGRWLQVEANDGRRYVHVDAVTVVDIIQVPDE